MDPGTLLSHYEIVGLLGKGGMGEVYRARDTKLEREVALKILPAEMAADPARLERFEREAKSIAALSHPHVVKLYSVERFEGSRFLTMELIEGLGLDALLADRELPLDEALRVGIAVADGLAAAHARGIVHRDLKPANVMLTDSGHVQVLDFGLAKPAAVFAGDDTGTELATEMAPITEQGHVVGTVAYMSPEQAQAQPVDARTDVFSLGILLYRLTTGTEPFTGETKMSVLSAIIREQPQSATELAPEVPRHLGRIIAKCLQKDPMRRYQSALGVRNDLEALVEEMRSDQLDPPATSAPAASRGDRTPLWRWVAAALVPVAALLSWQFLAPEAPALSVGSTAQLTRSPGLEIYPVPSPDGDLVVYAAGPQGRMRLYVRSIGGGRAIPLTEDFPGNHQVPRWSPDGTRVAFSSDEAIWTVPALGGVPRQVATSTSGRLRGLDWSPDGESFVYSRGGSLWVVPAVGGDPRLLLEAAGHSPVWSPDGRWIAAVRGNNDYAYTPTALGNIAASAVFLVPAAGGEPIDLTDQLALNISPVWTPDSRALYLVSDRDGNRDVHRIEIDAAGNPRGNAVRLTTALDAHTIGLSGTGDRLAYSEFQYGTNVWSLPVTEGEPASVREALPLTRGDQVIEAMAVSPDGQWLAFDSNLSGNQDIYRIPIGGGEEEQLTTHPAPDFMSTYSPDGSEITFYSMRSGARRAYTIAAGGGRATQVTFGDGEHRYPTFSPDGMQLAFSVSDAVEARYQGVGLVSRDGPGLPGRDERTLTSDNGNRPRWSPDGSRIAYLITLADRGTRLMVVTPDGGEPRELLAVDDRSQQPAPEFPAWSADSRTIYYTAFDDLGRSSIWSIPVEGGEPTLKVRFDDPTRWAGRREFTAHGGRFYFTIGLRESDVWVLEIESH